jgi:hypothetical protein
VAVAVRVLLVVMAYQELLVVQVVLVYQLHSQELYYILLAVAVQRALMDQLLVV